MLMNIAGRVRSVQKAAGARLKHVGPGPPVVGGSPNFQLRLSLSQAPAFPFSPFIIAHLNAGNRGPGVARVPRSPRAVLGCVKSARVRRKRKAR